MQHDQDNAMSFPGRTCANASRKAVALLPAPRSMTGPTSLWMKGILRSSSVALPPSSTCAS